MHRSRHPSPRVTCRSDAEALSDMGADALFEPFGHAPASSLHRALRCDVDVKEGMMPGKILARMILDGAYLIGLACLLIGTAIAVSAAPAMAQPQPEAPSSIAPETPDRLFG